VLLAMTVSAWSRFYGAGGAERLTAPASRPLLESIAGQCLYGRQILAAGPSSLVLGLTFARPRWTHQPWRTIAAENTPGQAPIGVPVLITQGAADKVVPAAVTARFVRGLCRRGDVVQERLYPGVEHFEAGILAAPDVLAWIRERFAGRPAPSTCR
jgi:alpha-beta hydrolase superfamily lysophospholipase